MILLALDTMIAALWTASRWCFQREFPWSLFGVAVAAMLALAVVAAVPANVIAVAASAVRRRSLGQSCSEK